MAPLNFRIFISNLTKLGQDVQEFRKSVRIAFRTRYRMSGRRSRAVFSLTSARHVGWWPQCDANTFTEPLYTFSKFGSIWKEIRKLRGGPSVPGFNVTEIGTGRPWPANFGTFQYSYFSKISQEMFFRWVLSKIGIKNGGQKISASSGLDGFLKRVSFSEKFKLKSNLLT